MKRLTGNYYFKATIFGLVLMVGYWKTVCSFPGNDCPDEERFRRAKREDLLKIKFLKP